MLRTSTWFSFQPPPDWGESNEGGRIVYRSPAGEALIISSFAAAGHGSKDEEESVRERLLQNAFSSAIAAASQPDLQVKRKLAPDSRVTGVEAWTWESETIDGVEIFFQTVFRSGMGVMLVTFEAYNSPTAKLAYEIFVKSVKKAEPTV